MKAIRFVFILLLSTIVSFCSKNPLAPIPLPDDSALFLSLDGGNHNGGLWVLGANTLELIDSLSTGDGTPFTIEFSPDGSNLYTSWDTRIAKYTWESNLYELSTNPLSIVRSVAMSYRTFVSDKDKYFLISFLEGLEIFDRETLSLVKTDSTIGFIRDLVASPNHARLYFDSTLDGRFRGIVVYDLETFSIERVIAVADSAMQRKMQPADLAISPDEHYAFLTVFNWRGGGGFGSFIVVDLTTDDVVCEYPCGSFSQMGVSPDGKYVYISDPAGYKYMFLPTNHVLRYNVRKNEMKVFIDGAYDLGFEDNVLETDKIEVAPDNRTLFITISSGAKTRDGEPVEIAKVDALTRDVLGTFSLPRDHRGYITQNIVSIKLGKY